MRMPLIWLGRRSLEDCSWHGMRQGLRWKRPRQARGRCRNKQHLYVAHLPQKLPKTLKTQ